MFVFLNLNTTCLVYDDRRACSLHTPHAQSMRLHVKPLWGPYDVMLGAECLEWVFLLLYPGIYAVIQLLHSQTHVWLGAAVPYLFPFSENSQERNDFFENQARRMACGYIGSCSYLHPSCPLVDRDVWKELRFCKGFSLSFPWLFLAVSELHGGFKTLGVLLISRNLSAREAERCSRLENGIRTLFLFLEAIVSAVACFPPATWCGMEMRSRGSFYSGG